MGGWEEGPRIFLTGGGAGPILDNPVEYPKEVHIGLKYHCKHCSYKATQKGNLKELRKSGVEGNKYLCKYCSFQATSKNYLL